MKNRKPKRVRAAFTLVELLAVMGIIAVLFALVVPAFTSINTSGNIGKAIYDLGEALQNARTYAMANNTYVWVGFAEEMQTSSTPAARGMGRVVLSIVASRDGRMGYDPSGAAAANSTVRSQSLIQISKLVKLDNIHLQTFPAGNGAGTTFSTRPAFSGTFAQIAANDQGIVSPSGSMAAFTYPLGSSSTAAQYTFGTMIQYSPRGEALVNDASQVLTPVVEIGLRPTHGATVDTRSANVAAVQVSGITGAVNIFRP